MINMRNTIDSFKPSSLKNVSPLPPFPKEYDCDIRDYNYEESINIENIEKKENIENIENSKKGMWKWYNYLVSFTK